MPPVDRQQQTTTSDRFTSETWRDLPGYFVPLMQALQFQSADAAGLANLTDKVWQELLDFCDLAHLALPLLRKGKESAPAWVVTRTETNRRDNERRTVAIAAAYREIAAALASAGVEHVVVKGFSQHPDFVEHLEDRMQSDIDLYCTQASIPDAWAALVGLGYEGDRSLENYPADHLPEMTRRRGWIWRGNMYDPEMPPAVDVHFCFWNTVDTRLTISGVEEFWSRRRNRHQQNMSFPSLSSIDNLAFSALHVLRDLLRGDWVLHHVYELATFLHTHADDHSLWATWQASHNDQLRSLQMISFWLARDWFYCRWPEAVSAEMAIMPLPVKQWLEKFGKSSLTGMFHPNKHGVWLHLALVASRRDRLRVLYASLLPLRLPAIGAAGQGASKTRRTRRFWPSQRHLRYLLHTVVRAAFHLQTSIDTLWHGLSWWLSRGRWGKSTHFDRGVEGVRSF